MPSSVQSIVRANKASRENLSVSPGSAKSALASNEISAPEFHGDSSVSAFSKTQPVNGNKQFDTKPEHTFTATQNASSLFPKMSTTSVTKKTTRRTVVEEKPKSTSTTFTRRSYMSPRSTAIVTRTSLVPTEASVTRTSYSLNSAISGGGRSMLAPGSATTISSSEVNSFTNDRHKEKKNLQNLNERLASYIERVRFLEAQNKKLIVELEDLRKKWGSETQSIKELYETELKEARQLIDDTEKDKAKLEVQVRSMEDEISSLKQRIEDLLQDREKDRDTISKQNQKLADMEPELNMLNRRITSLEEENIRDKTEIRRLQQELNKTKLDLDNETLAHIDAENRRQTLEEEIEFLKNLHEQEVKELSVLAYRDTTQENREFWNNELAQAIRDIQNEYESRIDVIRTDLESHYNIKVNEFRSGLDRQVVDVTHTKEENKTLRTNMNDMRNRMADIENKNILLEKRYNDLLSQMSDRERTWDTERIDLEEEIRRLRMELEQVMSEIGLIADKKLSLELEIAAYRKLLEGEETRMSNLSNLVSEHITVTTSETNESSAPTAFTANQLISGEMSAKTTYQRSAKGPVTIQEIQEDGKYILLENSGRKEENLDGWQLKRRVDGRKEYTYLFHKFVLGTNRNRSIRIWSKGNLPPGSSDLEFDGATWGVGSNVTTQLFNEKGEEKATHVQKTVYTS